MIDFAAIAFSLIVANADTLQHQVDVCGPREELMEYASPLTFWSEAIDAQQCTPLQIENGQCIEDGPGRQSFRYRYQTSEGIKVLVALQEGDQTVLEDHRQLDTQPYCNVGLLVEPGAYEPFFITVLTPPLSSSLVGTSLDIDEYWEAYGINRCGPNPFKFAGHTPAEAHLHAAQVASGHFHLMDLLTGNLEWRLIGAWCEGYVSYLRNQNLGFMVPPERREFRTWLFDQLEMLDPFNIFGDADTAVEEGEAPPIEPELESATWTDVKGVFR
ncbi:MAG: hypothetical protein OES13_00275 [Acidimicrobiia bacterium]|nr:hypothetical protein [Acidimicrobiia bacterium]